MNSRIFALVSSLIALSTVIPSVHAYDFTGCDQVFPVEQLRHGYSYNFWDDYTNHNTYKHQVYNLPSVVYSEQYDYNGSTSFPGFGWAAGLVGQGYQINPGQTIRAVTADSSYPIIYRPASRSADNLILRYTIQYYAQNGGGGSWTGPYTHVECQPYEVTWCGDGVKDTDEGETCDDGAQNGQPGKCNVSCNGTVPNPPINGVCNPAYDGKTLTGPYNWNDVKGVVCSAGIAVEGTGFPNGPWTWSCNGQNGGTNASCSAAKTPPPINGVCSTTVTGPQSSPLSNGSCNVGPVIGFTSVGTNPVNYSWTCGGQNGGAPSPTCTASYNAPPPPVAGVCSATVTGSQSSPLSNGSCNVGTVAGFTSVGTNPVNYSWTCTGLNGGASSPTCTASYTPPPPPVNGVCSSTVTGPQSSPLSNGACNKGSVVGFTAVGTNPINYSWTCSGEFGGSSSPTCNASYTPAPVNGVCGPTNGTTVASKPSTGLCNLGTPSVVAGSGPWTWSCAGANGGTTANCSANPTPINGVCGPAHNVVTTVKPSTGLCNVGTPSVVAGTGPWTWSCAGSFSGTTANCNAPVPPPSNFKISIKKYIDGFDAQDIEPPVIKNVGDTGVYTIIVANEGPASTSGTTTVIDDLPFYINMNGAITGAGWNCSASTVIRIDCRSTSIIASGSVYPTISVPIKIGTGAVGTIRNLAIVSTSSSLGSTVPGKDRDPASIAIRQNGKCSSTASGSLLAPIAVGVCDIGSPIGFTAVGTNPINYSWNCSGVNGGSSSPACSASYATGTTGSGGSPILSIKKAAQGKDGQTLADAAQVTPGSAFNYTYTVANTGSGTATGVTITDTFPRYISVTAVPTGTDWTCSKGTKSVSGITYHTVICTYTKPLLAGATAPVVTVPALLDPATPEGSQLRNIAYVCRAGDTSPECNPICIDPNNPSCTPPPPPPNCDPMPGSPNYDPACVVTGSGFTLSIKKYVDMNDAQTSASGYVVSFGQLINYTLVVKNEGPSSTTGTTTVTDTLPTGVALSGTVTGTNWNCSGITAIICTSTQVVASGAFYPTISIPVRVTASSGTITNIGIVENPKSTTTPGTDRDPAVINVGNYILSIKKAAQGKDGQTLADAAQVTPGSAFNYTYTVANTGSGTATGVTITDTFPRYISVTAVPTGTDWTCSKGTKSVSGITYHTVICTYTKPLLAGATAPVVTVPALLDPATPEGSQLRNIAYVCRAGDTSPECNPICIDPNNPSCTPPPPPPNCDPMPGSPNYDPACVVVTNIKRCDVLTSNPSASPLAPGSNVTYSCSAAGTGFLLSNLEYRITCGSPDPGAAYSSSNTRNCTLPNSYGASQTVTCSVRDSSTGVIFSGSDAGSCSVTKSTTNGGGSSSTIYYIPKCVNNVPTCTQYVANTLAECNAANGNNCMSHAQCDPAGLATLSCSGDGSGYCGDGVLQPYAGEECDVRFHPSIPVSERWCGQPGEVDASGNSVACKIRITTNPGANPITGLWMTIPRLSNARLGNSQLDIVPGNPSLGRVNFASYQMVLGIDTQAFTIADTVGFGIKAGEPLALAVPKNKYFCLGTTGTALNPNTICTPFGTLANASYQTYPNVAEPGNPYILIGDGYYQYPSTQNSDGSWNYLGGYASSPNNIDLFRGPLTYGSNTLANAFRGKSIGTDNLTLFHYSSVGGQPIDLVTLPVKVASPMVGTSSTTLTRSSLSTFMNSRSVLDTFLTHFSNSTTTSTVTSTTSTNTAANVISLGAKNAPVGGLLVYGTTELSGYKLNGNNNVYAVKGNVTLNCTSGITATPLEGVKTLVVENGDLTINCNNSYPSSDTYSSWAFIVKGGNIKIANGVTNLVGVYVTIPEGSVGGKYLSLEGTQTNNIVTINGSLYGDASDLFNKRNYLRGTNAYDTLTTGVILSYSNRALVSPPPLLSQFLNNYTVTRVVR